MITAKDIQKRRKKAHAVGEKLAKLVKPCRPTSNHFKAAQEILDAVSQFSRGEIPAPKVQPGSASRGLIAGSNDGP